MAAEIRKIAIGHKQREFAYEFVISCNLKRSTHKNLSCC